jgi:hypothetical protein
VPRGEPPCKDRSALRGVGPPEPPLPACVLDRGVAHFVVFGSFETAKDEPDDVDVIALMEDSFDLASVGGKAALAFRHMEADAHFGASVFWTRSSGAVGGEQTMIEYWQVRREGGQRGILEIVREGS